MVHSCYWFIIAFKNHQMPSKLKQAEREKDRKEKLKKFEDWQKVKKEKEEVRKRTSNTRFKIRPDWANLLTKEWKVRSQGCVTSPMNRGGIAQSRNHTFKMSLGPQKLRQMQSRVRDARKPSSQSLQQVVVGNSGEDNLVSEDAGSADSNTPTMSVSMHQGI